MFLTIFGTVLLPLLLVAGAGYLFGRHTKFDSTPLARATFYLFNPCLVFVSLSTTTIAPELLGQMALLKLLGYAVMTPLARLAANRLRLPQPAANAFIMAVIYANSGNLGLPLNEYAFGKAALALAVISFVTDNLMANSLGVYLAARGRANVRQSLMQVLLNPALYAVPLGLAAHQWGWTTPLPVARALDLLSRAAVPTMLVVLGMQLAALRLDRRSWTAIGVASAMRLLITPLLALLVAGPMGLTGLARQVGILQMAGPTAVSANIIASRYDAEPGLVAGVVLVTTLFSLVTVTVVLSLLLQP